MRIGQAFGIDPWQAMRTWSYREYLTTLSWLEEEWNVPSRSDYYMMQLITVVNRIMRKNPRSVKLEDAKMKFSRGPTKPQKSISREQAAAASKSRWLSFMTAPVQHRTQEPLGS